MAAILIVDDERVVAKGLEVTLQAMGHEVIEAVASADDAIRSATNRRPDLVLMDIRIKGELDGVQCAHVLRERFGVPVVYLTAHVDDESVARAMATEPAAYLLKPFHRGQLQVAIEIALYKHEIESRLRERERWLLSALRSMADAVLAVDGAGHVRLVNPEARKLLGFDEEEVIGQHVSALLRLNVADHVVARAMYEKRAIAIESALHLAPDGRRVPVEGTVSPMLDAKGQVQGAILVLRGPRQASIQPPPQEEHIADVMRAIRGALASARIEIQQRARLIEDLKAVPVVRGAEEQLRRVFFALLINAVEAIPEGAAQDNEVRVSCVERGSRVVVSVEDTGRGMPRDVIDRIFEPSFSTKDAPSGVIGLAACVGIVRSFGGSMAVDSIEGNGSRFEVSLRKADAAPRAVVLVIEEDEGRRRELERRMAGDCEVQASCAAHAELLIATGRYDAVVSAADLPPSVRPVRSSTLVLSSQLEVPIHVMEGSRLMIDGDRVTLEQLAASM
jgi:PAS domain S-box-containing protein